MTLSITRSPYHRVEKCLWATVWQFTKRHSIVPNDKTFILRTKENVNIHFLSVDSELYLGWRPSYQNVSGSLSHSKSHHLSPSIRDLDSGRKGWFIDTLELLNEVERPGVRGESLLPQPYPLEKIVTSGRSKEDPVRHGVSLLFNTQTLEANTY